MDDRQQEASTIIHSAAAAAGAVGFLSPIPGADAALIGPIQAVLVLKLTSIYGQRPRAAALKAAGYAALGQVMGKGAARLLTTLVPGIGSVARAGVAAGMTEAIGWAVVENLQEGDTP